MIFSQFQRRACFLTLPQVFLFELTAAITALRMNSLPDILSAGVLELCLLFLSVSDLETYVIPNFLVLFPAFCRILVLCLCADTGALFKSISSAATVVTLMIFISMAGRRICGGKGFGGGDIKLFALAALYLGFERSLLCILDACAIGLCTALFRQRKQLPFGPAISAAVVICLLLP